MDSVYSIYMQTQQIVVLWIRQYLARRFLTRWLESRLFPFLILNQIRFPLQNSRLKNWTVRIILEGLIPMGMKSTGLSWFLFPTHSHLKLGVYLFHFHLENSRISPTAGSVLWILWYVVLLNCGDIKCIDFWSTCNALRVFLEVYIIVK